MMYYFVLAPDSRAARVHAIHWYEQMELERKPEIATLDHNPYAKLAGATAENTMVLVCDLVNGRVTKNQAGVRQVWLKELEARGIPWKYVGCQ